MDKETPALRRLQSSPRSDQESTRIIPREQVDPRTVPRWIPTAQDNRSLRSPPPRHDSSSSLPNEERHQPEHAIRLPHNHNSARECGQSVFTEVSESRQSTVGLESTQSESKWAARPISIASITSTPPGAAPELHPPSTANNETTHSSTVLEHLTGVSEPDCHEGLPCAHFPPQRGSCGDADRGLVPGDPLLPRAAQPEGQSPSTSAAHPLQSQS